MALRIVTGKGRLTVYVNNSEDGPEYRVFSGILGKVLDKSDIPYDEDTPNVISISIPEEVEYIEPGTFTDFVNLNDVEIRGDVYGVQWCGGTDGKWIVPISPATLVEELKRGTGRIEIIRK